MPHHNNKIIPDKKVCFPKLDMVLLVYLCRTQHYKNGISVLLQFGTLVCQVGIFHRQLMQPELYREDRINLASEHMATRINRNVG